MMMRCWGRNILGRCGSKNRTGQEAYPAFRANATALFLLSLMPFVLAAAPAKKTAKKSPPVKQAAPAAPAKKPATPSTPDLAALARADAAIEKKQFAAAERILASLPARLPKIRDHVAWLLASARYHQEGFDGAVQALDAVWAQSPPSPLLGRAAVLAATCRNKLQQYGEAVRVLRLYEAVLPLPQGLLVLAESLEKAAEPAAAAAVWQRLFYEFPLSAEAEAAEAALARLRAELGDAYPPVMPRALLERAAKLLPKDPRRAAAELERALGSMTGADADLARLRIASAAYHARRNESALDSLSSLKLADPDADAERLHYVFLAARRLEREGEMQRALDALARQYPRSPWRLETLITAGNQHFLENEPDRYEPYFRACYESFADDPRSSYCHWRVTVIHYVQRRPGARQMLLDHLRRYPASEKANTALYFLGRMAETESDVRAARAFYQEAVTRYPNSFYGQLAKERLSGAALRRAAGSPEARTYLDSIDFPERKVFADSKALPDAESRARIERARLLASAGLDNLMEVELRAGARDSGQAFVLATELAALHQQRSYPDRAIRALKTMVPEYLFLPPEPSNEKVFRLAFPLPFRQSLERNAQARDLDPFLMAGLIRQESEFNPQALSRAKAYGLTQVLPSTGRSLSRKVGIRNFRTSMLWNPDVNMKLGAYYLRSVLNSLDGNVEATLAAYNAGPSRAVKWLGWGPFREPAEFIEIIPFSETRDYVQAVLRNASVYRRLYSGSPSRVTSANAPSKLAERGASAGNLQRAPAVP